MLRKNQVTLPPLILINCLWFGLIMYLPALKAAEAAGRTQEPLCIDTPEYQCNKNFARFKVVEGNAPVCTVYRDFINNVKETNFGSNKGLSGRRLLADTWKNNRLDLTYGVSSAGNKKQYGEVKKYFEMAELVMANGGTYGYELYKDMDGDGTDEHIIASYNESTRYNHSSFYIIDDKAGKVDLAKTRKIFNFLYGKDQIEAVINSSFKGKDEEKWRKRFYSNLEQFVANYPWLFEYENKIYFDAMSFEVGIAPVPPITTHKGIYIFGFKDGHNQQVCFLNSTDIK